MVSARIVFLIILLLFSLCCAAGYLPLRYFAGGLRLDTRLALLPLAGAVVTVLLLQWIHLLAPIPAPLALIGWIPAVAGLILFLRDHGLTFNRTAAIALAVAAVGLTVPLLPFLQIGYPTSVGILNNDAMFYVASDELLDSATYNQHSSSSYLIQSISGIRRYGINYLSAPVRALTGLRSWEVIHIAGGFGLFLTMCASFLLARALGANRPIAIFAGISVAAGHWAYRLYLDAVLAYMFGLAFTIAVLWTFTVQWPQTFPLRNRIALSSLLIVGLSLFYFDMLVLALILCTALSLGRWLLTRERPYALLGFPIAALVAIPVVTHAIRHFLLLAAVPGIGKHFDFNDTVGTLLHLFGMLNMYDYVSGRTDLQPLHLAGLISGIALLIWTLIRLWSNKNRVLFAAAAILPLVILFAHLISQGDREYHAHRVLTTVAALCTLLLAGIVSQALKSEWKTVRYTIPLLGATLFVAALQPLPALLGILQEVNNIVVTPAEKQVGSEWMPKLPQGSVVLIDLDRATKAFYSHYLYYEAAYGLGDESRVLLTKTTESYLPVSSELDGIDLSRVTHIIRMRGELGITEGVHPVVAGNERYLLFEVPRGGVVHHAGGNFHPREMIAGSWPRWIKQDGQTRACARSEADVLVSGYTMLNPAIKSNTLTALLNGKEVAKIDVPGEFKFPLKMPAGCNTITWHSAEPPRKPGVNEDSREFSVLLRDLTFQPQTK